MKAIFDTASFKKALTTVVPAVANKPTLPILSHVRIGLGNIDASDLQVQITAPVQGEGDPINLCVPADKLKAAVAVAGPTLEVSLDGHICLIKCGKHKFKVPSLPGQEFPMIDESKPKTSFQSTAAMHAAMASVGFAIAVHDMRDYLNGAFVECKDGIIETTATNGHFAATCKVGECADTFEALIRKPAFEILTRAAPGTWRISEDMIVLESDESRMVVKTMTGRYPDWRRIMTSGTNRISLPRSELLEAVGLSKLMRNGSKARPMKLLADGDVLKICTAMNGEEIDTELPVLSLDGGEFDISLDGDLLEPILKAHSDETVTFTFSDRTGSIMTENGDFRAVMAPLRM